MEALLHTNYKFVNLYFPEKYWSMNQSLERSIKKGRLELNASVRTGDDEQAADGDQAYLIRLLPVTDVLPNCQGHTESHATSRRTLNISMTNYSQLLQLLQLVQPELLLEQGLGRRLCRLG